jgi:phenylalanyl-tRNA synthetase alpha chain
MNEYNQEFTKLNTVNSCLNKRDELLNTEAILEIKDSLKTADSQTKKDLGQKLNLIKQAIQAACDQRIKEIHTEQEKDNFTSFDPTFYSNKYFSANGGMHPVTEVIREVVSIFQKMGFDVADGPLVESQEYCFSLLNMPDYHPARSMQDTFFLKQKDEIGENYVLRTHTSDVQVRYGRSHKPPFKVVVPGQVYRNENIDATHDIMFHQIECIVVDKRVSMSHLKTLIKKFYSEFFGQSNLEVRLRPSYFPYTVPSMEVDISNPFKGKVEGKLRDQEWIEAGGSGLIHPKVIENMGFDPKEYQGLAFGFGLDRMAQLKLKVSGMSQFFNGGIDFLSGKKF